jgi:hypothetical protein
MQNALEVVLTELKLGGRREKAAMPLCNCRRYALNELYYMPQFKRVRWREQGVDKRKFG